MFILISTLAVYLLLSLVSYSADDPGWSHTGRVTAVLNQGGVVGAWLADVLLYLFGYMAYLFPVMAAYAGWMVTRHDPATGGAGQRESSGLYLTGRSIGFVLTPASVANHAGACRVATTYSRRCALQNAAAVHQRRQYA